MLVVGLAMAVTLSFTILDRDAAAYASRAHHMLNGELPYVDFEFEHLPLAVIPVLFTGMIERLIGGDTYAIVLWAVMGGILFGVAGAVNRLGRQVGIADGAVRWLKISWAIIPLMAYRLDALSVLLAVAALSFAVEGRDRRSAWALGAGIAAKGWPIVLIVTDWWRNRRLRAVTTVIATGAAGLVLLTFPLFRSGREFFGVHLETVTGAFTVLARMRAGLDPQVANAAGASYVEIGLWAPAVNAAIGLAIGISALRILRADFNWRRAIELTGVLTISVMLLSPLLSAQFVFWITPFAALSSSEKVRVGTTVSVILTGLFTVFWLSSHLWWSAIVVARNIALMWTGWVWTKHLIDGYREPSMQPSGELQSVRAATRS